MLHEQPAIGQAVERVVRFPEKMRDGGFDQVEVAVVFTAVAEFVVMKVFEMFFALEPFLSRPAFSNLLEEEIPLGLVTVAAGRLCAVVTKRVSGQGPMFQMPLSWLAVWPADLRPVFFHQRTHGCVAIHRL